MNKRNLGIFVLIAGIIGFILAYILRNDEIDVRDIKNKIDPRS